MARIKIKDLPKDMKISAEEMRMIHAGASYDPSKFLGTSIPSSTTSRFPPPYTHYTNEIMFRNV